MPENDLLKILFVVNPGSGNHKTPWSDIISDHFTSSGHNIELLELSDPRNTSIIEDRIAKFAPQRVVAVGGDGTVALLARILLHKDIALGILPAGSANGMARELSIPNDPAEAIGVIETGTIKAADVVRINNDLISLHLSDIGLNARLIKHFDEGNLRGKLGYARALVKTLVRKRLMNVEVCIDGQKNNLRAEMVVLANASRYGTGATINPEGNLYDGKFEVVIMRQLAVSELFKMWFRFRPFDAKKMKVLPATSATIRTKRAVHFQVDGEYLGKVTEVQAEIVPGQLKIIIP